MTLLNAHSVCDGFSKSFFDRSVGIREDNKVTITILIYTVVYIRINTHYFSLVTSYNL